MTEGKFEESVFQNVKDKTLTLKQVREVCEAYEIALKQAIAQKEVVKIKGLFHTSFRTVKSKPIRNPKTGVLSTNEDGTPKMSQAKTVASFKTSKSLVIVE